MSSKDGGSFVFNTKSTASTLACYMILGHLFPVLLLTLAAPRISVYVQQVPKAGWKACTAKHLAVLHQSLQWNINPHLMTNFRLNFEPCDMCVASGKVYGYVNIWVLGLHMHI